MITLSETGLAMGQVFVTISGHARNGAGVPLLRQQRLLDRHGKLLQSALSNELTGEYSFTVTGNANDIFDVVGVPEPGEQAPIFNAVVGVAA